MVSRLLPVPLRMKARAGLKYQIKEKVEFSTLVLYTEAYHSPFHQWKDTAHGLHGTKCQSTKGVHKQGEAWTLEYVMNNVE